MTKWISIAEQLPGVGLSVFVQAGPLEQLATLTHVGDAFAFVGASGMVVHSVTHWREPICGIVVSADLRKDR